MDCFTGEKIEISNLLFFSFQIESILNDRAESPESLISDCIFVLSFLNDFNAPRRYFQRLIMYNAGAGQQLLTIVMTINKTRRLV